MKIIKNKKIGINRGVSRLWIEGKMLSDHDWVRGTRFQLIIEGDYITIIRSTDGGYVVAGNDKRPIIDLNNSSLPCGKNKTYTMTVEYQSIVLELNEDLNYVC